MKKWMRLVALLVLTAMCLSALVACNNGTTEEPDENLEEESQTPSGDTPAGDGETEDDKVVLLDPSEAMILVSGGATEYVIIRDNSATDNVKAMVSSFRNKFWAKTKADIKVKDDTATAVPKEIIISMMDGRTQPAQEYAKLTAPQGKGYRISIVGESLVVASQEEYLQEALDLLTTAICDCGNGIWGVPKEYVGEMDLPTLPGNGVFHDVGQGNYVYSVNGVNTSTVEGYMTALAEDGFEVYSEHTVGESKFFTYVKDSIYGQMSVHTMYHAAVRNFRLTYGPMQYLPNVEEQPEDRKADPTITQMYMQMVDRGLEVTGPDNIVTANKSAPGMSYLIQISDGRFIILDGGNADGSFQLVTKKNGLWVAEESSRSQDAKRLYDTMVSMKPAEHEKPIVAMWYISHAHGDHYGLANQFLTEYQGKIKLDMMAFTVPAPANLDDSAEKNMNTLKSNAQKLYGADFWIMHTGQVLQLPGASIEVLSTVEDIYCGDSISSLSDINNTCSVIRIHIGNLSFMVLGDAYPVTGQFMADAYGEALQSDIMQLSHHGFNGGVLAMYKLVDPKICFWPCDEYRFQCDGRNLGTNGGYEFNYFIRNEKWKRDRATGKREHYTASFITTIDVNTGKATKK